jgi:hypothetical protein
MHGDVGLWFDTDGGTLRTLRSVFPIEDPNGPEMVGRPSGRLTESSPRPAVHVAERGPDILS